MLVNAAGRFQEGAEGAAAVEPAKAAWAALVDALATRIKRAVVFSSFVFTKQPSRIRQVLSQVGPRAAPPLLLLPRRNRTRADASPPQLKQVYTSPTNIDDDLVRSIAAPADDPHAADVFYRIITGRGVPMNWLLDRLAPTKMPLLLLWGAGDPWCVPARATQIQNYYPAAERVDLAAGHW